MHPYFRKPQHIIGIVLLPIIVVRQVQMILSDPYFNPFSIGEVGFRSWAMILGMAFWWFILYFLLKKTPIPIFSVQRSLLGRIVILVATIVVVGFIVLSALP